MEVKQRGSREEAEVTDNRLGCHSHDRKDPSIFVTLNYLNINCTRNLHINAHIDGVSKTGLVCHINSWYDTIMYAARASIICRIHSKSTK